MLTYFSSKYLLYPPDYLPFHSDKGGLLLRGGKEVIFWEMISKLPQDYAYTNLTVSIYVLTGYI